MASSKWRGQGAGGDSISLHGDAAPQNQVEGEADA